MFIRTQKVKDALFPNWNENKLKIFLYKFELPVKVRFVELNFEIFWWGHRNYPFLYNNLHLLQNTDYLWANCWTHASFNWRGPAADWLFPSSSCVQRFCTVWRFNTWTWQDSLQDSPTGPRHGLHLKLGTNSLQHDVTMFCVYNATRRFIKIQSY